jgi:hypothetical protein
MGRYYSGDIEGKFWFGVQDSDDASHFGGSEIESEDNLTYLFDKSNLPTIDLGIQRCVETLGDKLPKLEEYFGEGGKGYLSYNPREMCKDFGLSEGDGYMGGGEYKGMMENYARLILGQRIKKCVESIGKCEFKCEI